MVPGGLEGSGRASAPLPLSKEFEDMPHLQNGNMAQRHKIPEGKSKKNFTKHAVSRHPQNSGLVPGVMRGGIRF